MIFYGFVCASCSFAFAFLTEIQIGMWNSIIASNAPTPIGSGQFVCDIGCSWWVPGEFWLVLAGSCFIIYGSQVLSLKFLSILPTELVEFSGQINSNNIGRSEKVLEFCLWYYRKTPFLWSHTSTYENNWPNLTEFLITMIWKAKVNNYWNNAVILTILSMFVPSCADKRFIYDCFTDGKSINDAIFW